MSRFRKIVIYVLAELAVLAIIIVVGAQQAHAETMISATREKARPLCWLHHLASVRNKEAKNPDDHVILPTLISNEPLGPMVRRGDDEWFAIVKWVIYGLLEAEEYGVTKANVDSMKANSQAPVVQRMLGSTEDTGKLLGLDKDWLLRAIKTSGNYGEMFERNVGPTSAVKLPRGMNNLWHKGGLMDAYPVR